MSPSAPEPQPAPRAPDANPAWPDRLALLLLSLAVLLPGVFGVSLLDRDEGWYAQVSREMLVSGDVVVPQYLGEPWIAKPPLLYWGVALLYRVFGMHDWVGRLISVAAMTAVVQLTYSFGVELHSRRAARYGAATLAVAGLPTVIGKLLLTDALLLALMLAAFWLWWRIATRGATLARALGFWLLVALAVLTKGPAIFLFGGAFAIGLLLDPRRRAWLRSPTWWLTAPALLLVALPWYGCVAARAGGVLAEQFLWFEILARIVSPTPGYLGPPGYHLAVALLGWLPWTPLIPGAVIETWQARRTERGAGLLLVWALGAWLLLELIPTKLPHYALPCYVPLALMAGRMWERAGERVAGPRERFAARIWTLTPVALGAALTLYAAWLWRQGYAAAPPWSVAGAALVVGFVWTTLALSDGRLDRARRRALATTVVFHALVGLWALPSLEPHRLSRVAAERVNALHPAVARVWVSGYGEPSLFFYLDAPGRPGPPESAAAWLAQQPADEALLIAEDAIAEYLSAEALAERGWTLVAGFNPVTRRPTRLWISPPTTDRPAAGLPLGRARPYD